MPRNSIDDLLADPLPDVSADDVLRAFDGARILAAMEAGGALNLADTSPAEQGAWLCQARLPSVGASARTAERMSGCLQAILASWASYTESPYASPAHFDVARLTYAYAVHDAAEMRSKLDAGVRTLIGSLRAGPGPTPDPAALQSFEELVASGSSDSTDAKVVEVVLDAVARDPDWFATEWRPVGSLGDGLVTTRLDSCLGLSNGTLEQLGSCANLIAPLWKGYVSTGTPELYAAAQETFRWAVAIAKRAGGSAMDEFLSQLEPMAR